MVSWLIKKKPLIVQMQGCEHCEGCYTKNTTDQPTKNKQIQKSCENRENGITKRFHIDILLEIFLSLRVHLFSALLRLMQ